MNLKNIFALLFLVPGVAFGAVRTEDARIGVNRVSQVGSRMPTMSVVTTPNVSVNTPTTKPAQPVDPEDPGDGDGDGGDTGDTGETEDKDCREAYRDCMDQFCLLDESEGARCACSSNIEAAKPLIQEIQKIQAEADELYTEGVERELLGAKASWVFGESERAKNSSKLSGISFLDWINSGVESEGSLDSDSDIGDNLYAIAADFCRAELNSCPERADMEEVLYSRKIVADCKSFNSYLAMQKSNAEANKRTAEAAIRKARMEMFDVTNKYDRQECLVAYKACISDKGGCGTNFENCLDASLLNRRAASCDGVLDQCMAVKDFVLQDWEEESKKVLADAAEYVDKNARATCFAKIQLCLEDSCSTGTNPACLNDINVAAGICPIIDECNALVPGLKESVKEDLASLRTKFCQNDLDKCLRDKCGENFTAPECVGKSVSEIAALCPQSLFVSCKNETQFDILLQAVLLQMDYRLMTGCVNYFSEQLGRVCGTDMSCLPTDTLITSLAKVPETEAEMAAMRETIRQNAKTAVDEFFVQFEKDKTVAACMDSQKPADKRSLGDSVFNTAKMIAQEGAENTALRAFDSKIAELSRQQDIEEAEKNCYNTYQVGSASTTDKNGTYIKSVVFEPALRNCRVCRIQRVCEKGGESKMAAAMKGAAGGLSFGASTGTMVTPGWGTAIGAVVGAVGGGLYTGLSSKGIEEFCQEIEACEDVNF